MNDVMMLQKAEPRKILETIIREKVPVILTYLSREKWHVAKVIITQLGASILNVEVSPRKKPHPLNIQVQQPVGVSLKYGYGKFIFETTVTALNPPQNETSGGTITLAVPNRIEFVQRRSYFRVNVPESMKVNVMLWHRRHANQNNREMPENYWQGRLVDISAGGAQVAISNANEPDFKKGQFITIRFTPLPYEMPLMFNAQIRNILPTADKQTICIGLQIVGLEASLEGRETLSRLVGIVEKYYQINRSGTRQQDVQPINR